MDCVFREGFGARTIVHSAKRGEATACRAREVGVPIKPCLSRGLTANSITARLTRHARVGPLVRHRRVPGVVRAGSSPVQWFKSKFSREAPPLDTEPSVREISSLTAGTLATFLSDASGRLCIVDFYTEWCGPCKIVDKELSKLPAKYLEVRFAKYDCEKVGNEALATELEIKELPTIIVYKDSKQLARFSGVSCLGEVMGLAEIWNERFKQEQ